jgi:hypothetical protein
MKNKYFYIKNVKHIFGILKIEKHFTNNLPKTKF